MKKYLYISIISLSFIPFFASADILYYQDDSSIRTSDPINVGYESTEIIKATNIITATTTFNQIYVWLEANNTTDVVNTSTKRLVISINCKKSYATTTTCTSAEGWAPGVSSVYQLYPFGNRYGTTTLTTTRASIRFQPALGEEATNTPVLSPNGIYSITIEANPTGSHDIYTYGSSDDDSNMCWQAYYARPPYDNCIAFGSGDKDEDDMKELSFVIASIDANDTSTRITSFIPSNTLVGDEDNPSSIIPLEPHWYYNPTEFVGSVGYDQIRVDIVNAETSFQYTPEFFTIDSSGADYGTVYKELTNGIHQVNVCFYRDWEGTDVNAIYGCKDYQFVVGTTTLPSQAPYLGGYDPLYGGIIPEGEEDCSALGSLTEKAGCYIANAFRKLFIPTAVDTATISANLKTGVLSKFPIGYVTSLVTILDTEATTTFPVASFTIKEGEYLSGDYSLDIGQIITDASVLVNDDFTTDTSIVQADTSQNVWDMIMPTLNVIGYSLLILTIVLELFGLSRNIGFGSRETTHITGISKDNEISYETPGFSRYKKRR